MSSAEVIDALFDRTVDIAQSLPKSGPIQTSYEEKLALYSLYKQATEGDVKTRRPGMLDMLGRAKFDAWSNRRGMSSQEAKQLYVESMLKTMRKFSDRPEAMALIEELESFSGDVAQRVMSARAGDSDSDSSSAGPSPRLLQQHRLASMASNAVYNTAGEEEDERDSVSHLPRNSTSGQLSRASLGQGLSSLQSRREIAASGSIGQGSALGSGNALRSGSRTPLSAVDGASAMAVRGGGGGAAGGTTRDDVTSSRAMDSDEEGEGDDELGHSNVDPRRRSLASAPVYANTRPQQHNTTLYGQRGAVSGPGSARGAFSPPQPPSWQHQRGTPLAPSLDGRLYAVPGQRYPGPPASDVVGGGAMGGGAGASMYSAVGPSRPTPSEQHYYHHHGGAAGGDTSMTGGRAIGYGPPSSVGGRSAGQRGGARSAEVDTALQSIQASLAALHERMNRVDGGGGRGAGAGRRGALSAGYRAFADALHDIAVLFGLRSDGRGGVAPTSYRGDGTESVGSRAGKRNGNGAGRPTGRWALVRLLIALAQLTLRVALDATSVVVVLSVLLFVFNRTTGRGDPLLLLRLLRQWFGIRIPASRAIERRITKGGE